MEYYFIYLGHAQPFDFIIDSHNRIHNTYWIRHAHFLFTYAARVQFATKNLRKINAVDKPYGVEFKIDSVVQAETIINFG